MGLALKKSGPSDSDIYFRLIDDDNVIAITTEQGYKLLPEHLIQGIANRVAGLFINPANIHSRKILINNHFVKASRDFIGLPDKVLKRSG